MKKVVNNFGELVNLLKFKSSGNGKPEIYYFVQVIQRKKENPHLDCSEIQRYAWWVTDIEYLKKSWDRLRDMCDHFKARAYISITPRSLEKFGKRCLLEYSRRVINDDYSNIQNIPKKVALSKETIQSKGIINKPRWIIDIDTKDQGEVSEITNFITNYTKLLSILETPNGYHLVIESFNYRSLDNFLVSPRREDYKITPGKKDILFTLRREGNTILYAVTD